MTAFPLSDVKKTKHNKTGFLSLALSHSKKQGGGGGSKIWQFNFHCDQLHLSSFHSRCFCIGFFSPLDPPVWELCIISCVCICDTQLLFSAIWNRISRCTYKHHKHRHHHVQVTLCIVVSYYKYYSKYLFESPKIPPDVSVKTFFAIDGSFIFFLKIDSFPLAVYMFFFKKLAISISAFSRLMEVHLFIITAPFLPTPSRAPLPPLRSCFLCNHAKNASLFMSAFRRWMLCWFVSNHVPE